MTLRVINAVVFGGCLVRLLYEAVPTARFILLTVGAFGMLVGRLGRAYARV